MGWLKKVLIGAAALVALWVVAVIGYLTYAGAWGAFFPSGDHETVPPEIPDDLAEPAVLLFTKTNAFRHKEGISAGVGLVKDVAARRGWSVFHTENGAVFNPDDLRRFGAVMFHNVSGDVLSERQRRDFQQWLTEGGGWVGTHAAGDGSHGGWAWYVENLVGAEFTTHIMGPQFQVADVTTEATDHPAAAGLPVKWRHKEEWYSWKESPRLRGFTVIASIDEGSYNPEMKFAGAVRDLRMGDHPVVWSRCVGRGRALYSALGHAAEAYDVPEHRRLLENALAWAMDTSACP